MKKFFILFILCFLFVGCAFDTDSGSNSNLTVEYWYYTGSTYPLRCEKYFCNKKSALEYDVISIEEYCFYTGISPSIAISYLKKGYYDDIKPSTTTISTRTKDTVLNSGKVFHYSGITSLKIYEIR